MKSLGAYQFLHLIILVSIVECCNSPADECDWPVSGKKSLYRRRRVIRVNTTTTDFYKFRKALATIPIKFDVWRDDPERMEIMATYTSVSILQLFLNGLDIPNEIAIPDVATWLDENKNAPENLSTSTMSWDTYHRLKTIYRWMYELERQYPEYVKVINYGKSTERRDLKIMVISKPGTADTAPIVWMDGGIHAREWISPATVTYMAREILKMMTSEERNDLIDTFSWHIVPVFNPDGYEFSHVKDRLWRKTRSRRPFPFVFRCMGVDANRNWRFQWDGPHSSTSSCSNVYRGPKPASEPEVSNAEKYLLRIKDRLKLFIQFHSFGQKIFYPWRYEVIASEDEEELNRVARNAIEAIRQVYGTEYITDGVIESKNPKSGSTVDWVRGVAGVKYAFGYELRDNGTFKFLLPEEQIIPSGIETLAGVMSMASDVKMSLSSE